MGIRRHTASKDSTITNAFKPLTTDRANSSNMGRSDAVEVFYLSESEGGQKSRALFEFDLGEIKNDPKAATASYYLRLFNVPHHETTPEEFTMSVLPLSQSWKEGYGMDLSGYTDEGYTSGSDTELGVTWKYARSGSKWNNAGGDFHSSPTFQDKFNRADGDLKVDITSLVNDWTSGVKDNDGVVIKLTSSQETGKRSFYTKKFSARTTEYYYRRPVIEERWDSSVLDDRSNFFPSSSAAPSNTNLNTIHFYNYQRGQLNPVAGDPNREVFVKLYRDSGYSYEITSASPNYPITSSIDFEEKGRYKAEFALDTTSSEVYDEWYSGSEVYHQDRIKVNQSGSDNIKRKPENFIVNIPNLQSKYEKGNKPTLRVVTRKKNKTPSIYSKTKNCPKIDLVRNIYYQIERAADGKVVVPYGTGSEKHTKLSYDVSGSYFTLNTNILEKDLGYKMTLAREIDGNYTEFDDHFKFRVV